MTGLEPRTSGVTSVWSTNYATTAALDNKFLVIGISVTRLGDLLDLWQLFKAFGNN